MGGLTEGRIVHFVMPDGQHRPAIVVRVWRHQRETDGPFLAQDNGLVQLQVFTDGSNDGDLYRSGLYWATSILYSATPEPWTWHWIEAA